MRWRPGEATVCAVTFDPAHDPALDPGRHAFSPLTLSTPILTLLWLEHGRPRGHGVGVNGSRCLGSAASSSSSPLPLPC